MASIVPVCSLAKTVRASSIQEENIHRRSRNNRKSILQSPTILPVSFFSKKRGKKRRRIEDENPSNDDAQEEDIYSVYDRGYFLANSYASYTISLDGKDDQSYLQKSNNMGISVVGQEKVLFFEYVLPDQEEDGDDYDANYQYTEAAVDLNTCSSLALEL